MSLRTRLTLVAAAVVAVVVAAASVTTYFVMRRELIGQVDSGLLAHAVDEAQHPQPEFHGFGEFSSDYVAIVAANGQQANPFGLPITSDVRRAAAGKVSSYYFRTTVVRNHHVREIVAPIEGGGAIVIVRIIDNVHHDLERLRLILLLVSLGGVAAAAIAGFLVSRTTLAPVRRLTSAAERIADTRDPSERVPAGRGELGRLGASFNTMLAALDDALETQRRFVADASHELRTPLTSMQTNIEVLKQQDRLDPAARDRLFEDLHREAHEMRDLISGLLELARGDDSRLEHGTVQLDDLVEGLVERARSRYPRLRFEVSVEPTTVEGSPDRIERAVWNLLENAGKWSPEGGAVAVALHGGELVVRDHGPGIAPEDREHVFDRFYRSAAARSLPGSGLGLAIVREVAEAHGGSVRAEEAPGGGALMRLRLDS